MEIALAHDYLTQCGGAERVALLMAQTFPDAPMFTSLYAPATTFPAFSQHDIRPGPLNRFGVLRRHHRLAFALMAPAMSATTIDADVVLVSSSGWAHGIHTQGRQIVYCHTPARWLYQGDTYLGKENAGGRARAVEHVAARATLGAMRHVLRSWDGRAAARADRYLANSRATQKAIKQVYGIDADILHPPPALTPDGPERPVAGVQPGYLLCVARLLPYKHVELAIASVLDVPGERLVIVGDGPLRAELTARTAHESRIELVGRVPDAELRWLYRNCRALVACSYEDFGLSPLEAASFGRPTIALRAGGYLDTVIDGETGVFFDSLTTDSVTEAIRRSTLVDWNATSIERGMAGFSVNGFERSLRQVVAECAR